MHQRSPLADRLQKTSIKIPIAGALSSAFQETFRGRPECLWSFDASPCGDTFTYVVPLLGIVVQRTLRIEDLIG